MGFLNTNPIDKIMEFANLFILAIIIYFVYKCYRLFKGNNEENRAKNKYKQVGSCGWDPLCYIMNIKYILGTMQYDDIHWNWSQK